jgi:hypothetical protein
VNTPSVRRAKQPERRCKIWGVQAKLVELENGDMLESARVDELLPQADVALVNNKVFLESSTCLTCSRPPACSRAQ